MKSAHDRDAHGAIRRATVKAAHDPLRPTYHFHAPAQWMNDPNGTFFRNGVVELFYQFNPYSDTFGKMHWGHARTRDYLTWEHLPIALTPRSSWKEDECWSGCCTTTPEGKGVIFYTSIEGVSGGAIPNTIRVAHGDASFLHWDQEREPVIDPASIPERVRNDVRDPYVFSHDGTFFVIVGAVTSEATDQASVLIFRATDETLLHWEYAGHLFDGDEECTFPECPNFVKLGDRWVLVISPMRPVEYHVGAFSSTNPTLEVERSGVVDFSSEYYATNTIVDDRGRTILFAWIRGFPKGRGWNGCLALPREIRLAPDGTLLQYPIKETERLRLHSLSVPKTDLGESTVTIADASIYNLEFLVNFSLADNASLDIEFVSEESTVFHLSVGTDLLRVGGINVPAKHDADSARSLRLFTDRSVIELFADDGRYCVTRVVESLVTCNRIVVRKNGGVAVDRIDYWSMRKLAFEDRF